MIRKITCILFALLSFLPAARAQQDNTMLKEEVNMNPADTQKLMLAFSSLAFTRNFEYFNSIQEGFTLFGYELNPRLAYMPNPYLRLEAGVFLRKDYGNSNYTLVQPTFTIKASKRGYSMLIGNLQGSVNHQLVEPIYNLDNVITQRLENGGQFLIEKKRVWNDVWIDWQKAIYPGSPFQETIWAGFSSRFTVAGANKNLKLIVPLQGTVFHHGGQIEVTDSPTHIVSIINAAGGLMLKWKAPKATSFVQELRTENYYVYYRNGSPTPLTPVNDGYGLYLNASIKTCYHVEAMVSYWNGNDYITPMGAPLYQSISSIFPYNVYHEDNRQLLFLRLMYEHQWFPDFYVGLRFEPYYDLNNDLLEYSYSFFATYRKDFAIAKLKR